MESSPFANRAIGAKIPFANVSSSSDRRNKSMAAVSRVRSSYFVCTLVKMGRLEMAFPAIFQIRIGTSDWLIL